VNIYCAKCGAPWGVANDILHISWGAIWAKSVTNLKPHLNLNKKKTEDWRLNASKSFEMKELFPNRPNAENVYHRFLDCQCGFERVGLQFRNYFDKETKEPAEFKIVYPDQETKFEKQPIRFCWSGDPSKHILSGEEKEQKTIIEEQILGYFQQQGLIPANLLNVKNLRETGILGGKELQWFDSHFSSNHYQLH